MFKIVECKKEVYRKNLDDITKGYAFYGDGVDYVEKETIENFDTMFNKFDSEYGTSIIQETTGSALGTVFTMTEYALIDNNGDVWKFSELPTRYVIRDSEAGNEIEDFDDYANAESTLFKWEYEDKQNGEYTEDFYEIYDRWERRIV